MGPLEDRGYALLAGAGERDLTPRKLRADGVGDRAMLRHAWCRDAAAALRERGGEDTCTAEAGDLLSAVSGRNAKGRPHGST